MLYGVCNMGQKKLHNLTVLNAKERSQIMDFLSDHFGIESGLPNILLMNKDNDLFTVAEEIDLFPLENLKINSLGLYLGEWHHGELRMSVEGSQLLGPFASKNLIDLNVEELRSWLTGHDLLFNDHSKLASGYQLMAYPHPITKNRDFLSCGRFREDKLLNFIPKARRVKDLII